MIPFRFSFRKPSTNDFEEAVFECSNCGKKMKILKRKGYNVSGLLCQKCGQGTEKLDEFG